MFSCHASVHLSFSLAHFKVSWCVILVRREVTADESDTASKLLSDLLHHTHATTLKTHSHAQIDKPKHDIKCLPLIYIKKTQTSLLIHHKTIFFSVNLFSMILLFHLCETPAKSCIIKSFQAESWRQGCGPVQ